MQAHRLTIRVPDSGHVEFDLPRDLVVAGEAEVIVLITPRASGGAQPGSPEAILALEPAIEAWRAANPDKLRSADEIDASLAEERASWDDPR